MFLKVCNDRAAAALQPQPRCTVHEFDAWVHTAYPNPRLMYRYPCLRVHSRFSVQHYYHYIGPSIIGGRRA